MKFHHLNKSEMESAIRILLKQVCKFATEIESQFEDKEPYIMNIILSRINNYSLKQTGALSILIKEAMKEEVFNNLSYDKQIESLKS